MASQADYVFGANGGKFTKNAGSDGAEQWVFDTGSLATMKTAARPDGHSYVGDYAGDLHKLDPDGTDVWTESYGSTIGGLVYYDGHVYVGVDNTNSSEPVLIKLSDDGTSTTQVWTKTYSFFGDRVVEAIDVGPNGEVAVSDSGGSVWKFDSTGSQVWSKDLSIYRAFGVNFDPNGNVLTAQYDNNVQKLASSDGSVQWTFSKHSDSVYGVSARDGHVYSGADDGLIYKIDDQGNSATDVWSYDVGGSRVQDIDTGAAGHVYGAVRDNGYLEVDASGNEEWTHTTSDAARSISAQPAPINTAPTADFTYAKNGGTVDFTDASSDPDGSIQSWSWDFGDGATSTQQSPSHTYSSSGTYTVQLTVTDDAGATGSAGKDVSVTVTVTGSGSLTGSPETLSGSASLPISGSGALTDKKASTSTAATLPIGGSGGLTGSKESLTAAATLPISGSGSLTGGQEETAAAAALPITGDGALNDTGEALSAAATLPIGGSGSLSDQPEAVAGAATLSIVGSGSLAGREEGLTGDATLLIVGSGTLADRKEAIDGGNIVTGAGSLTAGKEKITGDATLPITGGGSLTGRQTRLETAAVLPITGSGMLTDGRETIFGGTFSRLTELNGSLEESPDSDSSLGESLGSDTSLRTTLDFSIDLNK
jgi:PKD repeat protein